MKSKFQNFKHLVDSINKAEMIKISLTDDDQDNPVFIHRDNLAVNTSLEGQFCVDDIEYFESSELSVDRGDFYALSVKCIRPVSIGETDHIYIKSENMESIEFDGQAFYYRESDDYSTVKIELFSLSSVFND